MNTIHGTTTFQIKRHKAQILVSLLVLISLGVLTEVSNGFIGKASQAVPEAVVVPPSDSVRSVERGRDVFEKNCTECHAVEQEGESFGPNLAAVGGRLAPDEIRESIVDPNRRIAKGFQAFTITTVDGHIHSGRLKSETPEFVEIDEMGGNVRIPVSQIEDRVNSPSEMPNGFKERLSAADLSALVAYLTNLR